MGSEATILVVDDEELLRNALVFQFKREGFNVLAAENGKAAFEIIKNNKVDAVVSDIQMPGGNGIELLKDVKNYDVEIPVLVFITAFADITEAEAYDLGANAIFSKPFDRKQLVKCIKEAVDHKGRTWKTSLENQAEHTSFNGQYPVTIGRGGAFVEMGNPTFKNGEILKISLSTEVGGHPLEIKGSALVRWVRNNSTEEGPAGVGLEFLKLGPECIPAYEAWLNGNVVKPFIPKGH